MAKFNDKYAFVVAILGISNWYVSLAKFSCTSMVIIILFLPRKELRDIESLIPLF